MNNSYKGIEKRIDVSKLDMELIPDIEDDSVGKVLIVNDELELEWSNKTPSYDDSDIVIEINITKEKIEALIKRVEEVQTSTEEIYKEFYTSISAELNKINLSITSVSDMITTNKDLFDQYVNENDSNILEIGKIIETANTQIELLNEKIGLMVESSEIVGSYLPGNNDAPTTVWHNQINPLKNATLNNVLFEQDSGWVKNSSLNNYYLMMAGTQNLELENILSDTHSVFTIDAWIKPYTSNVSTLLNGIYLYDNNGNISIINNNIEAFTFYQLPTDVISHVCFVINCNKGSIEVYVNGVSIDVNISHIDREYALSDVITMFDGFSGEVYSFKYYSTNIPQIRIEHNYNQEVNGFMVYKTNLIGYFEARCAESIYSDFTHLQSSIKVLKDSIDLKVSEETYKKDMDSITGRINEAEIKLQPESIILTVTSSEEWKANIKDTDDKINNLETVYSIMLSNDAQVISTDYNRYPLIDKTYTTEVTVYKGAKDITDQCIITPPDTANGIIVSMNDAKTIDFTVDNSIQIGSPNVQDGTYDIEVNIPEANKSFIKKFSWAISRQGDNGQDGTGIIIKGSYTLEQWLVVKDELSKTATAGDSYMIDGILYIFDGEVFVDCGNIKGEEGEKAKFVKVSGDQFFKYENSFSSTPSQPSILVTCLTVNIANPAYQWSYKTQSSSKYIDIVGENAPTYIVKHDDSIWGEFNQITYRCTCDGIYDEMTIVKLYDGDNGADSYTVVLSNECHSVLCDSSGVANDNEIGENGRASSDIIVYKGTKKLTAINTGIPTTDQFIYSLGTVNGGTANRKDSDTFYLNTMNSDTASIPVSINLENKQTISKIMSVTKSIAGADGEDGTSASYVNILASSLFFKCASDSSTYAPNTIELKPILMNSSFLNWQYSINSSSWNNVVSGQNGLTISSSQTGNLLNISSNCDLFTESISSVAFKVNGTNDSSDIATIAKLKDGDTGADSVNILLDNENHTFVGTSDGNANESTITINILGFEGVTKKPCVIGSITGNPSGMTITPSGSGTVNSKLTVSVTASMSTKNGIITIPITCSGVTLNKIFTFSIAVAGINGENAKSADIVPSTKIFKSTNGGVSFLPSSIKLSQILKNVSFLKWQYSTDGGVTWINAVSGTSGITIASNDLTLSETSSLFSKDITSISFKLVTSDSTVYDTETISKIYDVTDLQIGARNLVRNSAFLLGNKYWLLAENVFIDDSVTLDGNPSCKSSQTELADDSWRGCVNYSITDRPMSMEAGQHYSYSCWYYVEDKTKIDSGITLELKGKRTGQTSEAGISSVNLNSLDNIIEKKWTRITKTISTEYDYDDCCIRAFVRRNGTAWFTNFKLEKGTAITGWNPATEDILEELYDSLGSATESIKKDYEAGITTLKDSIEAVVKDTTTIKDNISTMTQSFESKIEQTSKDVTATFTEMNSAVVGDLQAYKEEVQTMIRQSSDGIEIGKSDSKLSTQLSNNKLAFKDEGIEVAYISNKELNITNAVIKENLSIGGYQFKPRSNGNMSLVWKQ